MLQHSPLLLNTQFTGMHKLLMLSIWSIGLDAKIKLLYHLMFSDIAISHIFSANRILDYCPSKAS